MNPIQTNTFSLRLAQTYGVRPVRPAPAFQPGVTGAATGGATQAGNPAGSASRAGVDTVELTTNAQARERIAGMVAARVGGSIDFTLTNEGVMSPGQAGALKLHRQPADLNTAATGVVLGRQVDHEA